MIQTSPFSQRSWKRNIWGLLWQKFIEWTSALHTLIFTDIALLCSVGRSSDMVSALGLGMTTFFGSMFYQDLLHPNYRVSLIFLARHLWAQPYTRTHHWALSPIPHGCLWKLGNTAATPILWNEVVKRAFQGQKISEDWVMIPLWQGLIPVILPTLLAFADFALIFSGTAHCCFSDYLTLFPGAQVSYGKIQNTKGWKLNTLCQLNIYIHIYIQLGLHKWALPIKVKSAPLIGVCTPDCLSSVMRQINKTKTSTDKPGANYMIVPKLESHTKGAAAAVNYLSCCMKIEKKSVWLSCSLAWLSLPWVGNLPILHGFLALWTQRFFFPMVKTHPVLIPWSPRCKLQLPAAQLCPAPPPCNGEPCRDLSAGWDWAGQG